MKKRLTIITSVCLSLLMTTIFASALTSGGRCFIDASKKCGDGKYSYTRLNGQSIDLRMMSVVSTGEPAYCIDFGNSLLSQNERQAYSPDGSGYWNALPAEVRKGISLCALYGYPNNLLGAGADDAYAATQALMWEFQCGIRTSTTTNSKVPVTYRGVAFSADKFSSMLSGTAGMTAYNNLVSLVYRHSIVPTFGTMVLEFNKETKMYTGAFVDSNGVLSDYAVSCDNSNISISKQGNILTLESKNCEPDFTLKFDRILPSSSQSMLILNSLSEGQECLIGTKPCPMSFTATAHIEPLVIPMHKIGICKVDSLYSDSLSGELPSETASLQCLGGCILELFAAEDIYTEDDILRFSKDDLVDTITTESDGIVYSCELFEGKYYLQEAVAPEGYLINDEKIEIEISENDDYVVKMVVKNERIPEPPAPPIEEPPPPPVIVEDETPLVPATPPVAPEIPATLDENNLFASFATLVLAGVGCIVVWKK